MGVSCRLLGRSRNFTIYKYNIIHHTVKVHSNMAANQVLVGKLYRGVMEEVVSHVRDAFLDEGVDEAVLQELKQIWENKLGASKVIDPITDPAETSLQNRLQQSQQSSASGFNQASQQSAAQNKQGTNKTVTSGTSAVQNTVAAPAVRMVPVQIPAHALQGGEAGKKLQAVLSSPTVTAALALPVELATNILQQHINAALQPSPAERTQPRIDNAGVQQLDGPQDSSDEEEDDAEDEEDDADDDDERDEDEQDVDNEENPDEEPLNSEDDVSDEDPGVLFETENVVVCQYDKITRSRNRWNFHLKDGIMNINGRDYVFQRANGDAEW